MVFFSLLFSGWSLTTEKPETRRASGFGAFFVGGPESQRRATAGLLLFLSVLVFYGCYTRKNLAFDCFEERSATGRYVGHGVCKSELVDAGHGVSATYE